MIKNFLVIALRKMGRNRMSAFVNVAGLALGISGALIIATLLRFESGFNTAFPKFDRLYRVVTDEYPEGKLTPAGVSPGPMAEALARNFPGVESAVLTFVEIEGLFSVRGGAAGDRKFRETGGVVRAEPAYFRMFDIEWLSGDPRSLAEPKTVALARGIAEKYFGDENPIGKVIRWNNHVDLTVVGVVPDPPVTTDLRFTVYISSADLPETEPWVFDWTNFSSNVQAFVLLRPGASAGEIESALPKMTEAFYRGGTERKVFHLQPLAEMHYRPEYADIFRAVGRETLAGLGLIAVFLVLTSCINFVNMATAQAAGRSREIGVRKVLGAVPRSIVLQFLGETFLIVAFAAGLSLVIAEVVTPAIADRLEIPVAFGLTDPVTLLLTLGLVVITTALAGFYPAMMLAGFRPAAALKGAVATGGLGLRRGLVAFQFAVSLLLIIGVLVVTGQMRHLLGKGMGFRGEGVVVVPLPLSDPLRLGTLRNGLLSDPDVQGVSFSYSSAISENGWNTNVWYTENGARKFLRTDLKYADPEYFSTYGLELVSGRAPTAGDTIREYVVNEAFAGKLGLDDPSRAIGVTLQVGSREPMPIVGVVRDFNTRSLHSTIEPCLIATRTSSYREAGIRLRPAAGIAAAVSRIERTWSGVFPEYVFESEFLDERIAGLYLQEQRVEFLFRVFAVTAIAIGCIGIIGLVSFVAARKTKEIGVRKVLGASTGSIVRMFSVEFIRLILVAFAVAAPAGYFAMRSWLEDFAYRIEIGPLVFIAALSVILVITGLTIGYRAIRAAGANPVESLRYE